MKKNPKIGWRHKPAPSPPYKKPTADACDQHRTHSLNIACDQLRPSPLQTRMELETHPPENCLASYASEGSKIL